MTQRPAPTLPPTSTAQALDDWARGKLDHLARQHRRRAPTPTRRGPGMTVIREGRTLISFADNDYLGLTHHPEVKAAAHAALEQDGAGAGAARLITGDHPAHHGVEQRLATIKQAEAACVFGSGYLANLGVIPAVVGAADLIVIDALAHACLFAGAQLSGAAVHVARHNDPEDFERVLRLHRGRHRHALVITEGVFSMDGDRAPLQALADLARRHDAWLLTDDAHALGVIGGGRGSTAAAGLSAEEVPLQMGTLSKAVGAYGGSLCASEPVVDLMRSRGRTFVYSTGLPPPVMAAAEAALGLIEAALDDPEGLCARPQRLAARLAARLDLPVPEAAIVPIHIGDPQRTLAVAHLLEAQGFLVGAIRAPTVPAGTERLRVVCSAAHTDDQIEALADALAGALE